MTARTPFQRMCQPRKRTAGAALLAAMLTVALVAVFASTALWHQWRGVETESAERARQQASWVLVGALDWARLILREDARSGGTDHLAEPWAVPLREARLSTFLAADRQSGDSGELLEAFLSGSIIDAQARMNLRNLVDGARVSEPALRSFTRLFEQLGLPQRELLALAENLRFALDTSADNRSGAMAPLQPTHAAQLVWLGLSPTTLRALEPHVTWLPARAPLNLNTAEAEALHASIPGLDMAGAQRMVAARAGGHFETLAAAAAAAGVSAAVLQDGEHSVTTRFFEVQGQLRLDETMVAEKSLLQRDGQDVRVLWRERVLP